MWMLVDFAAVWPDMDGADWSAVWPYGGYWWGDFLIKKINGGRGFSFSQV